ncbi:MAG: hypothetical protein QXS41_04140 [Candidatus Woesearchaeota archaeon]
MSENEIEEIIKFSFENKFYKILSLAAALKTKLQIPSTVLLLKENKKNLEEICNFLNLPLMVRVEYKSFPNKKVLGGIPLFSKEIVKKVSSFLLENGYFPIFHPNIERLEDQYSAGILIEPKNKIILVEIVGKGFDASDLRLGQTSPHEQFIIDPIFYFKIKDRKIISSEVYIQERKKRLIKLKKLVAYVEYVNKEGRLLDSLNDLEKFVDNKHSSYCIPEKYELLPNTIQRELLSISKTLYEWTINLLPPSKSFVASLSYINNIGWILWDIYGEWYYR